MKTSNEKILATVYQKDKAALVSIASWAEDKTTIQLNIDWNKLGIDPSKATITAPEIKNFQPAATFKATDSITVDKGKGLLLIIKGE
ncbi:MAG: glycoside hydrolase domain-containing protein [Bacteroidota bacterium]